MKTLVIILAQGQQSRLPDLPVAKQLLRLPACGNAPILYRTVHQVRALLAPSTEHVGDHDVRIVTWFNVYEALCREPGFPQTSLTVLDNPGNSSLKGLDAVLRGFVGDWQQRFDRVVVLLGDVVYSWACMRECLTIVDHDAVKVVCTSDLSRSGGEIWGLTWNPRFASDVIGDAITGALAKHPPFEKYQPGQLRRVLFELEQHAPASVYRKSVDDYTRDIDLPEHVDMLPALSRAAFEDDKNNGLLWEAT